MAIRVQLLSLVGLLFLCLSALSVSFWWNANGQLREIGEAVKVEAVTHDIAETIGAWAIERGVVAAALSNLPQFSDMQAAAIEAQRKNAGSRVSRALVAADGLGVPRLTLQLRDAEQARVRMIDLQSRVDQALSARSLGQDANLSADWFEGTSRAIESFQALRDSVARHLPPLDPRLIDSEAARQGIYQITEYGGRERGLLAVAVSAGRALTVAEMTALSEAAGHINAGWSMLRARRHLHNSATRQAIDVAQQVSLNNFEDLRRSMRLAGVDGRYPISAAEWSSLSTLAIDTVRAVQPALHQQIAAVLSDMDRRARFWVWTSVATLLASIILLVVSLRVILVGVVRDLEDQRQNILAMEKQERLSSLGALVAGVAHEINTPIGVAVTAASYLADVTQQLDRDYREKTITRSGMEEYIESAAEGSAMILRNLERAASLISSFKRISVDQASEEQRTFNLTQLVHDVLATLRPQLRLTPHRISANCPPELMMVGSPGMLAQIVTNLIMNSVTHAFPGERAGHIEITALRKGDVIRLIFRDDGVGATQTVLNRMFEPFFTTKRGSGGSGLGLSIVHTLVTQKLGGDISVAPADPGLRFEILLPAELPVDVFIPPKQSGRFADWRHWLRRWRTVAQTNALTQGNEVPKC